MKKRLLSLFVLCALLLSSCASTVPANTESTPAADSQTGAATNDPAIDSPASDTPTEAEMESLYKTAGEAALAKSYQYAYGLYMRLSYFGYKDSAEKADALRSDAYATPVMFVKADAVAQLRDVNVLGGGGYLYIASDGTVKYTYVTKDSTEMISETITPDNSLTNIKSIVYANTVYTDSTVFCVFLKNDGTLAYLYDSDGLDKKIDDLKNGVIQDKDGRELSDYQRAKKHIEDTLIPFIDAQTNVQRVVCDSPDQVPVLACLKNDGGVSISDAAFAAIGEWKDICDISVSSDAVTALNKSFEKLTFSNKKTATEKSSQFILGADIKKDIAYKAVCYFVNNTKVSYTMLTDNTVKYSEDNRTDRKATSYSVITQSTKLTSGFDNGMFLIDTNGKVAESVPIAALSAAGCADMIDAALKEAALYIGK